MRGESTIVSFTPPPPRRSNGDLSSAPVTDAEHVVIKMLARRAARKWLAEVERARQREEESEP